MTAPAPAKEDILSRVRERVLRFAAARASRDVAEDIAQETLLLLTTKYGHLDALADLVPLSMRIARFMLMNHWRKSRRAQLVPLEDATEGPQEGPRTADVEASVVQRLLLDDLLKAIALLGERCRRLLGLKLEGRDFEEIRVQMSAASINTVYTWDNRCRAELRERLRPHWDGSRRG